MRLFRDAKYVTSSAIVAVVLTALRSLLVLRIVGPGVIGAWKVAMLVYTTGEFARLGVTRGLSLRVPVLDGQGEQKRADRLAAAGGSFVLLVGAALALVVFAWSFFIHNPDLRYAFRLVTVVVLLAQPHQFLRDLATARHSFQIRAKEVLLAATVDFTAGFVLAYYFGLTGIGIATALAVGIPAVYLWRKQRFHFGARLDRQGVGELVRTGFPYAIADSAFDMTRFLDVLVMTPLLGPVIVGYYAVSLLIMDFATFVTKIGVSQVVGPHMLREFGKLGNFRKVEVFYEVPIRLFCYVLPPVLGIGSLFIDAFVRLVLPQYTPGIPAAQISMVGIFFMAVHSTIGSFFLAADKLRSVLKLFAVLVPAGAVAHYAVIKCGFGLSGIAWTSLAVLLTATSSEIYIARRGCGRSRLEIFSFLSSLYFPIAAVMALTECVQATALGPGIGEIGSLLLKPLILLLLYLPLLISYESRFSLLRTVRQTI